MGNLAVNVSLHGIVVEDRVVPVRRMVRIGEGPDSRVSFPGADVSVVRVGKSLALRGRVLEEGEEMRISLGPVDVRLTHTFRGATPSEWTGMIDRRFLAAAAVVTAAGTWIDSAEMWMERTGAADSGPAIVQTMIESMKGRSSPTEVKAAVSPPTDVHVPSTPPALKIGEGPRHSSDDLQSGTRYYAWYRSAVLSDPYIDEAFSLVAHDRTNAAARRRLAREAYNAEDWDTAAWHYRWLVQQHPEDRLVKLHLAWAERRRGRHKAEIGLYREILDGHPDHVLAQAGLAAALARMGRMDEATLLVDNLQVLAPMDPYTDMTIAMVEAIQGHDTEALTALERVLTGRRQLSEEMRLEMRRDLALDPVFASLRKHRKLRVLLAKHLGAGAPRPMR